MRRLLGVVLVLVFVPLYADNKVERYALIVVGCADTNAKLHPDLDTIDRNASFVQVARLYGALRRCGFEDGNIRILYDTGRVQPDWSERQCHAELARIRRYHFAGKYPNAATLANITAMMDWFRRKVDENDIFVFYLMTHGHQSGTVMLAGRRKCTSAQIQKVLSGLKTKHAIFCFETCFSGAILQRTDFPNAACVSAAPHNTPGWVDRKFANCVNFILAKANPKNDKNKDGLVSVEEAMEVVRKKAAEYEPKWREYLRTKYKFPRHSPVPRSAVSRTSIKNAVLKVGKNFKDFNLFVLKKKTVKKNAKVQKAARKSHPSMTADLKRAKEYLAKKEYLKAHRLLKRLAAASDKEVSEEAKKLLSDLKKDKTAMAKIKETEAASAAKGRLSLAKTYMNNGFYDKAEALLRRVMKDYAGTKWARRAEQMLEELEQLREEED